MAFGDQVAFSQQYGELKEAAQVESLHNMLKPFLLRRIKEDVEKSLPPKVSLVGVGRRGSVCVRVCVFLHVLSFRRT